MWRGQLFFASWLPPAFCWTTVCRRVHFVGRRFAVVHILLGGGFAVVHILLGGKFAVVHILLGGKFAGVYFLLGGRLVIVSDSCSCLPACLAPFVFVNLL